MSLFAFHRQSLEQRRAGAGSFEAWRLLLPCNVQHPRSPDCHLDVCLFGIFLLCQAQLPQLLAVMDVHTSCSGFP